MNEPCKAMPTHEAADIPIYKTVVWMIGIIGILAIGGIITLAVMGKTIPESIVALSSVAVGALAGVLAPSASTK